MRSLLSFCFLIRRMGRRISKCISTRPVAWSQPLSRFMTPCSMSKPMSRQSVSGWRPQRPQSSSQLEKKGSTNILIHLLTFLPALGIAIFFPNMFIKALEYAGIYATALLILLPAWMAWSGRYNKKLAQGFTVPGGKILLGSIIIFSLVLIIWSLDKTA